MPEQSQPQNPMLAEGSPFAVPTPVDKSSREYRPEGADAASVPESPWKQPSTTVESVAPVAPELTGGFESAASLNLPEDSPEPTPAALAAKANLGEVPAPTVEVQQSGNLRTTMGQGPQQG